MEFVEAVKIEERMCEYYDRVKCNECPLSSTNNKKDLACTTFMWNFPEEAETLLMKWAEEHPAKTNKDKFNEIFQDFPMDIMAMTKRCIDICPAYPHCEECKREKAIDFWKEEYKEVSKDADSN